MNLGRENYLLWITYMVNNLLTKSNYIIKYYIVYLYYFIKKKLRKLPYKYFYTIQYNWSHQCQQKQKTDINNFHNMSLLKIIIINIWLLIPITNHSN